jgi:ArsR family transcriptional regulator, virulence genes transcriptional regulator
MSARPLAPSAGADPDGFELEADLIRVLAHPKRLKIVDLLGHGPKTVTEIAEHLEMSLQNTSQHLRVMRDRGVVRPHRDGREVRYALLSPVLAESCRLVRRTLLAEMRTRPVPFNWGREAAAQVRAIRDVEMGRTRRPTPVPA